MYAGHFFQILSYLTKLLQPKLRERKNASVIVNFHVKSVSCLKPSGRLIGMLTVKLVNFANYRWCKSSCNKEI